MEAYFHLLVSKPRKVSHVSVATDYREGFFHARNPEPSRPWRSRYGVEDILDHIDRDQGDTSGFYQVWAGE